jgi:hypothetical protein
MPTPDTKLFSFPKNLLIIFHPNNNTEHNFFNLRKN